VTGNARAQIDWTYGASGPSFAFEGGALVDHSIYAFCTVGMPCDLSASLNTGGSCGIEALCTATLDGKTFSFPEGDISFTVPSFVPSEPVGTNCFIGSLCDYSIRGCSE
jgi:hypothetical protein